MHSKEFELAAIYEKGLKMSSKSDNNKKHGDVVLRQLWILQIRVEWKYVNAVKKTLASWLTHQTVLSISFEVDVSTGKVGGIHELFERWSASFLGGVPQKILKFRCLKMLFLTFSRQYLGLKNNQN